MDVDRWITKALLSPREFRLGEVVHSDRDFKPPPCPRLHYVEAHRDLLTINWVARLFP